MGRRDTHRDPGEMIALIRQHEVTILQLVPTLLQVLLEHPDLATCTSLRRVFVGGERLDPDLASRFHQCLKAELHNLYGPTEATIDATSWTVPQGGELEAVPIGRPVDNVQIYPLDDDLALLPVGTPGELYIGGDCLALGYLGQAELTAERFIPNPFSDDPGHRLYRTGDLGRFRPDGNLEFLGRVDNQVKVRGTWIEPGEIEMALQRHSSVAGAAVVAAPAGPGGEHRLVAFVTARLGAVPVPSDLIDFLQQRLPEAMIPSAVVAVESLPLTAHGKIDRRRLADVEQARLLHAGDISAQECRAS